MASLKEVFESDNWKVTKIMNGNGMYRVDAKTRFYISDGINFFSKWGSKEYVNSLSVENLGKKAKEINCLQH